MSQASGQEIKKVGIYFLPEISQTLADRTKWNNQTGLGLGIQTVWHASSRFSPFLHVSDDFIFYDDKVGRTNADGSDQTSIENALKAVVGTNINIVGGLHLSLGSGVSFINGQSLFIVRPGLGVFFGKSQRATLKIDYTEIFNRYSGARQNYSSLVFALGVRLF